MASGKADTMANEIRITNKLNPGRRCPSAPMKLLSDMHITELSAPADLPSASTPNERKRSR